MKFTRSISVDLFLTKQYQRKYNKHLEKIEQIRNHKENHQKSIEEVKQISKQLKIARDRARSFKQKQDKYQRGIVDMKMLKNIHELQGSINFTKKPHIHEMSKKNNSQQKCEIRISTQVSETVPEHKGKNTSRHENAEKPITSMRRYLIEEQNKKLAENIKACNVDSKNYKKKLATQVSEYLKLRQHMQRFKTNSDRTEKGRKPLKSERWSQFHKEEQNKKKYDTHRGAIETINPEKKEKTEGMGHWSQNSFSKKKPSLRIKTQNNLCEFESISRIPLNNLEQEISSIEENIENSEITIIKQAKNQS